MSLMHTADTFLFGCSAVKCPKFNEKGELSLSFSNFCDQNTISFPESEES